MSRISQFSAICLSLVSFAAFAGCDEARRDNLKISEDIYVHNLRQALPDKQCLLGKVDAFRGLIDQQKLLLNRVRIFEGHPIVSDILGSPHLEFVKDGVSYLLSINSGVPRVITREQGQTGAPKYAYYSLSPDANFEIWDCFNRQ